MHMTINLVIRSLLVNDGSKRCVGNNGPADSFDPLVLKKAFIIG